MNRLHIALAVVGAVGAVTGFRQISWHPPDDVLVIWVRGSPEQTAIYQQSLEDYPADGCFPAPPGPHEAGSYSVRWDGVTDAGLELASGVYFYRLTAGERVETRKLLLRW